MTYKDERDRLILEHRYLVSSIARKLKSRLPRRIDEDELVGYGHLVLIECAMRWDRNRGATFRTYAYKRIWYGILDALYSEDMLPRSVRKQAKRNGTSSDLPKTISLDKPMSSQDDGQSWGDLIEYRRPTIIDEVSHAEFPEPLLELLQRREREVLTLCFTKSLTTKRASEELGVSPTRICQIRAKIIEIAREYYEKRNARAI